MSAEKRIQKDSPLPRLYTITIAGASGLFAWTFSHPFEMWKNTVMTAPCGTSQAHCLRKVYERGLFKGLSSGFSRQIVYASTRLGCYPIFRDALISARGGDFDTAPSIVDRALSGALSGVFASMLSSPVEICLVLQTTSATKLSIFGAAARVYASRGIAGYWRGAGALASRAAVVGVCQVAVHDQTLSYLSQKDAERSRSKGVAPCTHVFLVNAASVFTAFFYAFCTMPFEIARVRMSAEALKSKAADCKVSETKYKNVIQTIARIARDEGVLAIYQSFLPYFCRCAMHTIVCFFVIEYLTQRVKLWRSS